MPVRRKMVSEAIRSLSEEILTQYSLEYEDNPAEGDILFDTKDSLYIQEGVNHQFWLGSVHKDPARPLSVKETADRILEWWKVKQIDPAAAEAMMSDVKDEAHGLWFTTLDQALEAVPKYSGKATLLPKTKFYLTDMK